MRIQETKKLLQRRRDTIQDWLANEAPYTTSDQRHLDDDTPEQAYWHFGYEQALADVIRLLNKADDPLSGDGPPGNEDTSKPYRPGG